jgi:hypothetical protein
MSNDNTASELEKLRAELAVLKEAQRETAPSSPGQGTRSKKTSTKASSGKGEAAAAAAELGVDEVKEQLEELASLLEQEIRDLPAITCLAIFSLGILMGRLLR